MFEHPDILTAVTQLGLVGAGLLYLAKWTGKLITEMRKEAADREDRLNIRVDALQRFVESEMMQGLTSMTDAMQANTGAMKDFGSTVRKGTTAIEVMSEEFRKRPCILKPEGDS